MSAQYIHIVGSMHTVCCAVVRLYDSQHINVKGISITSQTSGMSGISACRVSNLNIQLITACALTPIAPGQCRQIRILISNANMVEVHSSDVANYSQGFLFHYVHNIFTSNITATYSSYQGISLYETTNATITNPKASNNHAGMWLFSDTTDANTNTTIINIVAVHNDDYGMALIFITNVTIINPTAMYNGKYGIIMMESHNINIINATVVYNAFCAITMTNSINISIINTNMHITHDSEASLVMEYTLITSSSTTTLRNSSFTGIGAASNAASSADPTTHPGVIVLYQSSLYVSGCNFTENSISAVKAYASTITATGDLIFSNNTAIAGTAFILIENSILRLAEYGQVHFSNNHAINNGGVFYITHNVQYSTFHYIYPHSPSALTYLLFLYPLLKSTCFLKIKGNRSEARLTFISREGR